MVAIRHLRFLKVRKFTYRSGSEVQYGSPYQISCRSVKLLRRYDHYSILFLNGSRPPSWIWFTCILDHPQRVFGGLSHCAKFGWNRCQFYVLRVWPENAYLRPFWGGFRRGIWPLRWDTILTKLPVVKSTGHSGSSVVLIILCLYSYLRNGLDKRGVTTDEEDEEKEHAFLAFSTSFKITQRWLLATFLYLCSFYGGEHTDTNVWSFLLFLVSQGVSKIQP